MSDRRRCKPPWDSKNGDNDVTISTNRKFSMVRAYLQIELDVVIDYHNLKSNEYISKKVKENSNNVTVDVPIITTHETRTDTTSSDDLVHLPIAPLSPKEQHDTLTDILKQYPIFPQNCCNLCTQSFSLWLADQMPTSQPSGQSESTTPTPIFIIIPRAQAPSSQPSGQSENTTPTLTVIKIPQEQAPSSQSSGQQERTTPTSPVISIPREQAPSFQPSGQLESTTPTPHVMKTPREPEVFEHSQLYT